MFIFFFKQKTAYEMRISDWSSDVCSSDLLLPLTVALILRVQIAPNGHIGAQESELLGQCNAVHVTLSIAVRAVHASAIFVPLYGHVVREGRVRNAGLVEHLNRHCRFGKPQRGTI